MEKPGTRYTISLALGGLLALAFLLTPPSTALARNARRPHTIQYVIQVPSGPATFGPPTITLREDVRDDGARSTETSELSGRRASIREISDPARQLRTVAHLTERTRFSAPLSLHELQQLTDPPPATCIQAFALPGITVTCSAVRGESMLGHPVHRVRQTLQIAPGVTSVREILAAPALDWKPLQMTMYENGRLLERRRAVTVREGPPDPARFHIPQDFAILTFP